jgi:hypothetical protein
VGSWTITPQAVWGAGVDASGGGAYPLVSPASGLRGLVDDMHLATRAAAAVPPFALAWVYGLDTAVNGGSTVLGDTSLSTLTGAGYTPAHAADLLVVDALGHPVFNSIHATSYHQTAFGSLLLVHEWRDAQSVCRIVQRTAAKFAGNAPLLPRVIFPDPGTLDARAWVLAPPRVDAIAGATAADGTVTLTAGYNQTIAIAPRVVAGRAITRLTINSAPGAGLGRAPGCGDTPAPELRTINGQGGDPQTGDFAFGDEACLWLRRPYGKGHALQLGYDCKPCCDCGDYAGVQAQILAAWAAYARAAGAVAAARDAYLAARARWEAQRACRMTATLAVEALASLPYLIAAVGLCNPGPDCMGPTSVRLAFSAGGSPLDVILDPAGTYLSDDAGTLQQGTVVPYPVMGAWTASWIRVPARGLATARLRVVLPAGTPPSVTVTAISVGLPDAVRTLTL